MDQINWNEYSVEINPYQVAPTPYKKKHPY